MEAALLVVLGWALGLFTYPIARRMERKKQREEIQAVLLNELRELGLTLAVVSFDVAVRHSLLDDEWVSLLRKITSEYEGPEDEVADLSGLREMLAKDPKDFAVLTAAIRAKGHSLRLVPYSLPFLESQIHRLDLLNPSLQQKLLLIHAQLEIFNGQVNFVMGQFDKTFDPNVTGANRQSVLENIEETQKLIARRARGITSKIVDVLELWAN